MLQLSLRQFEYESDTWKRLLGFIMDENIHLKNRLVEILKNVSAEDLLEEMENFHNKFIKEDERIGLLRNDVAELDKLLVREIFEDGKILNQVNSRLNRLRSNIINAEQQFTRLKLEFNTYLSETLINSDAQKHLSHN